MLVFSDYHHDALGRSIFYLFADRLGWDLHFPDIELTEYINDSFNKDNDSIGHIQGAIHHDYPEKVGGIDSLVWGRRVKLASIANLSNQPYDIVIVSRPESLKYIHDLIKDNKYRSKMKIIAWTGNENSIYDWPKIDGLIATDEQTYRLSPDDLNKFWGVQEIGRHLKKDFRAIKEVHKNRISSFMNNIKGFDNQWSWNSDAYSGFCFHCDHEPEDGLSKTVRDVNVYKLWNDCKKHNDFTFKSYGAENEDGLIQQSDLYQYYIDSALVWHFKNFEGWGHSLLQSITCGRLVLIPNKYYRYRTAGKYLIPEHTCIECEWNADDILKQIKRVTSDIDYLNEMSKRCWDVANKLLDWEYEAERCRRWVLSLFEKKQKRFFIF